MKLELLELKSEDLAIFKKDIQEAFKLGAVAEFGDFEGEVLPEKDINDTLKQKGAKAYKVVSDKNMVGGAVVIINEETQYNHLDLLYVKQGFQGKGIGKFIWSTIEKMYPETRCWETCTPYFEKRNIHFYVNQCGFKIVEFFNPYHKDPKMTEDIVGGDYFFRFEKK